MERSEPWAANHQSPPVTLRGPHSPLPGSWVKQIQRHSLGVLMERPHCGGQPPTSSPKCGLGDWPPGTPEQNSGPSADRAQPSSAPRSRGPAAPSRGTTRAPHLRHAAPGTRPLSGDTRRRATPNGLGTWLGVPPTGRVQLGSRSAGEGPSSLSPPSWRRRGGGSRSLTWSERTTGPPSAASAAARAPGPRGGRGPGPQAAARAPAQQGDRRMKCTSGVTAGW